MASLEEENVLFDGEHLSCLKQFYDHVGFLRKGSWYEQKYENDNFVIERRGQGNPKLISKKVTKSAVIRRIRQNECLYNTEMIIGKLKKKLDPVFVLPIYQFEDEKDQWRYFAVELFSCTLYHYCKGQYHGPVLDESQASFQIVSAVNYIHNQGLVHGDLNPINIVIMSQHLPVRIKISDFGLSKFSYTKCESSDGKLSIDFPEICKRKYWSMSSLKVKDKYKNKWNTGDGDQSNPELICSPLNDIYPKEKDDVFAVGCIIFYFLARFHPFGNEDDPESILVNMKQKNMVNLNALSKVHAELYKDSINKMILQPKTSTRWLFTAIEIFEGTLKLKIDKTQTLGMGSFGTVFKGEYEGNCVAVKRITLENLNEEMFERETKEHARMDHENVLKLLDVCLSEDKRNMYMVLELCSGSMQNYGENQYNGPKLPRDAVVLNQIANGLQYIHSQNLVHRNIAPENILFSNDTPVQIKLSDCGYFENGSFQGTYLLERSMDWMAPEILEHILDCAVNENLHETIQSNVFTAGCIFFYFLSHGRHPFGDRILAPGKILNLNPVELIRQKRDLQWDDALLYNLIEKMLKRKEERIALPDVIKQLTEK